MKAGRFENFDDYRAALRFALVDMRKLYERFPNSRAYDVILAQLQQVDEWTSQDIPPTFEQKGQLYFGRLANTDVEPIDTELARRLNKLSAHIREWAD